MSRRLLVPLLLSLLGALLTVPAAAGSASAAALPGYSRWVRDTEVALAGSRAYVTHRVEARAPGEQLALNLDIDNTSLATRYRPGTAAYYTLRLARHAQAHGVAVLFNTARDESALDRAADQLRVAGFRVDGICGRHADEGVVAGKQRCRAAYAEQGWTLIANVGNRSTDVTGTGYERRYKLPDYGNRLG
ncbi:HAD family acid phosphatase [Nocardioides aurantiacus]|uniref:HAD family acid phosphatase n=1 Tax=Nocardioides aurantiacus TaxID=86796 RepID=UPI00403F528A